MPSVFPLDPTDVETFTVVTNPIRSYTSSSLAGSTGGVFVFPRRSPFIKDVQPDSSFVEAAHDDADLASLLHNVQQLAKQVRNRIDPVTLLPATASFVTALDQYMSGCAAHALALRLKVALEPVRFSPPPVFNSNTLRKQIIHDQLNTFYRTSYPTAHWACSNYNSLNFFTASMVPTSSVLLYPNIDAGKQPLVFHENFASGTYTPSGSFSFDFYINPRYQPDQPNGAFKAGTILHLSSTFALSLVSGSLRDPRGRVSGYRLQLQLSHSADIPPSQALQGSYPSDLVFLSGDNCLLWNHWHHVVVRWGTKYLNNGVGTFNVDGVDVGTFTVPSATIAPREPVYPIGNPDVLCMGNYYEGTNSGSNVDQQAIFFSVDPATRDGLQVLTDAGAGVNEPQRYAFNHPLNAELHDVAIRRCYMSDLDIATSASKGPVFLDDTFAFYVPGFFTEHSPFRQFVGDHGGILVTPFEEVDGSTFTPFSVALSFGIAGHYINLEGFVKDFGSHVFPRLHHLTASAITTSTTASTCNQYLYSQPFVVKRNLSVLPCDDGNFVPGFQLLVSEGLHRAIDDLGVEELSFVNLDHLVSTGALLFGPGVLDDGTRSQDVVQQFVNLTVGATPEEPFTPIGPAWDNFIQTVQSGSDIELGAPLTVFQRTADPSSNEVTIFDISNLFYGFRISPGTLTMQEPDLLLSSFAGSQLATGSAKGPISISLADDGKGTVYRADCLTPQATWNSCGNVYVDEGLILLKNPSLYFYGFNQYSLGLRGEQHVHVMKIDTFAPNNQLNSSSNPSYLPLPPTGYPNDPEDNFVYISGINFHDRDLNIVMKTQLAQPILKRPGDRLMFKTKIDF